MRLLFLTLLATITIAPFTSAADIPLCQQLSDDVCPTKSSIKVNATFSPSTYDSGQQANLQTASIAGADSQTIDRTVDFKSKANVFLGSTIITVTEKMLPKSGSVTTSSGVSSTIMVVTDDIGPTIWRIPAVADGSEATCAIHLYGARTLKEVMFALDDTVYTPVCFTAVLEDYFGDQWTTPIASTVSPNVIANAGTSNEKVIQKGEITLPGSTITFNATVTSFPAQFSIDVYFNGSESVSNQSRPRIIGTMYFDKTNESSDVKIVIPRGVEAQYHCQMMYSNIKLPLLGIDFSTEITT